MEYTHESFFQSGKPICSHLQFDYRFEGEPLPSCALLIAIPLIISLSVYDPIHSPIELIAHKKDEINIIDCKFLHLFIEPTFKPFSY